MLSSTFAVGCYLPPILSRFGFHKVLSRSAQDSLTLRPKDLLARLADSLSAARQATLPTFCQGGSFLHCESTPLRPT